MTEPNSEKLKPCPFCGGTALEIRGNGIGDFYIICDSDDQSIMACGARTSDVRCETKSHAIQRWNTRLAPAGNAGVRSDEMLSMIDAIISDNVYVDNDGVAGISSAAEAILAALPQPREAEPVATSPISQSDVEALRHLADSMGFGRTHDMLRRVIAATPYLASPHWESAGRNRKPRRYEPETPRPQAAGRRGEAMTDLRPRTFLWHSVLGKPMPMIIYEPRVGCADLIAIPNTELKLDPDDARTLDQLAADYPAPKETV